MLMQEERPLQADKSVVLTVKNLESYYGPIMAIRGVSLEVREGQVVSVLGANGAGKTTLLKTISGVMDPEKGEILYQGRNIAGFDPDKVVRMGIVHVPEGREVFPLLTVEENLKMGAYVRSDADGIRQDQEMVYSYFPILAERRRQAAGTLSGGQQQMLAIGRGLMARPKLMLLDEPSLGLSPRLVKEIFTIIRRLHLARHHADPGAAEPRAGRDHDAGRAECQGGAGSRRLRLCDGTRAHGDGQRRAAADGIEGRAGILSRRPAGDTARPEALETEENMAMTRGSAFSSGSIPSSALSGHLLPRGEKKSCIGAAISSPPGERAARAKPEAGEGSRQAS